MNSSAMYMYGLPVKSDAMYIDDPLPLSDNSMAGSYISGSQQYNFHGGYCNSSSFADDIYVPNEVVEELEWLSNFMEDSTPYHSAAVNVNQVGPALMGNNFGSNYRRSKNKVASFVSTGKGEEEIVAVQRCTHCAAEKTPQWRTGPQGPKTLCNACGVRYKSGRLVPEYRPANSPTFVQSQHSNSHRKVMELRRQKEQRLSILR